MDSEPTQIKSVHLSISVVSYAPLLRELTLTLESLSRAVAYAREYNALSDAQLFLVDNGPGDKEADDLRSLFAVQAQENVFSRLELLSGHGNIGYGAGHNLALRRSDSDFHLILNPDVNLDHQAIYEALCFLSTHPDVGGLSPYAEDRNGFRQFLCKNYPTVFDLILRGFLPEGIRRFFHKRIFAYDMRDVCGASEPVFDIPIISGCFMFMRRGILLQVDGFSSEYFMYFEDFDISLKLGKVTRLAYVPSVKIIHFGGDAARKGWSHILMFVCSMLKFYKKHGWRIF
ncbi:MAG: hypothetical protein WBN77_08255 [Desulfobacterales bacterium]